MKWYLYFHARCTSLKRLLCRETNVGQLRRETPKFRCLRQTALWASTQEASDFSPPKVPQCLPGGKYKGRTPRRFLLVHQFAQQIRELPIHCCCFSRRCCLIWVNTQSGEINPAFAVNLPYFDNHFITNCDFILNFAHPIVS